MEPYLFENMARTERRHWWFRGRLAIVRSVLDGLDLDDADILDVGAGTGATTRALRRYGRVEALELAPAALAYLRGIDGLVVHDTALPAPSLADAAYDLVTAFDVLEHIPDHLAAVADIRRILRPRGHFLCTVPAHPSLWTAHDEHHHHQRRYTRSALLETLRGGGLEVEFCSPWLTVLFPVFLADRLAKRLRPPDDASVQVPPGPVNRVLEALVAVERQWLGRRIRAPFGASLIALARRPGG